MEFSQGPPSAAIADDSCQRLVASALIDRSREIATRWLQLLEDVVFEDTRDIFPTDTYLDHVPEMIQHMGHALANDAPVPATDSVIASKAMQLGMLRFEQKASLSQLLREYDQLAVVLETVLGECVAQGQACRNPEQLLDTAALIQTMVRSILATTVESFIQQYEQQLKTERDKVASFNAFVSHELRQPLQAASLFLELLEGSTARLDTEERENLADAASAVRRASDMLADLSHSIETPDLDSASDIVQQQVDLASLTRDLVRQLQPLSERKAVAIEIADNLGELWSDRAKLQLILANLVSNAIKYSDPNKPERWVRVSRAFSQASGSVQLVVEDNGVGVEPAMHQRVFDLKTRARADTDEVVEGHGLGLFLVAEAVDDLGGRIELSGAPGQGTTVTLNLPEQAQS